MRRAITFFLVFCVLLSCAGCSDAWRKKFIRKKKETTKMPHIYQLKKYEKKPTPELYGKHYTYCVTWLSELIKVLGQNHKKDVRCIEEAVSNIRDMQNILVPEKAKELQPHIDKLVMVRDTIVHENLSQANKDYIQRTLDRELRFIRREFYIKKIQQYLRKSFEDEEQQGT